MNRREQWGLLSKIVTNATNQTCQHSPSWIFQMLHCILWSEMSLSLTTHIAGSQHSVLFQLWQHLPRALIWLDLNLKWAVTVIRKPACTTVIKDNVLELSRGLEKNNQWEAVFSHFPAAWPHWFANRQNVNVTGASCLGTFVSLITNPF